MNKRGSNNTVVVGIHSGIQAAAMSPWQADLLRQQRPRRYDTGVEFKVT